MDLGLDYSVGRPNLDQVWAAGYRLVLRYLSWLPNPKCISAPELAALRGKGFEVALNWEFDEHDALRGVFGGRDDATEAVSQARALNYPPGKTIYYSVDFDVTEQQQLAVDDYFAGAGASTHAADKRIGGYGGYWTIKRLFDAGLIDDGWQTYAWSLAVAGVDPGPHAVVVNLRGQDFWFDSRAALRQIQNGVTVGGADCDVDERVGTTYFMGQAPASNPIEGDDMLYAVNLRGDPGVYLSNGVTKRSMKSQAEIEYWLARGAQRVDTDDLDFYGVTVPWHGPAAGGGPLNITLSGTGTPA